MNRNPLWRLQELGQSVWYDNIGRGLLRSGGLQRLVDEDAVVGVTSNPTIFQKAVAEGHDYDELIRRSVEEGLSTDETVDRLMTEDVASACTVLRPVFEREDGEDGWVSIEVRPSLAYDSDGTLAEVHRLRGLVDRPNLLVKIPATREGVTAIRAAIAQGLSINVTLIFSLERYGEVMEAYLAGLEELAAKRRAGNEGLPSLDQVASVASFFVSRVDTNVDKRLEVMIEATADAERRQSLAGLKGHAAVANAKLAYAQFQRVFSGPRWEALAAQGANLQRPLWASTSTKNPDYRDVVYVEELIGPHTVNTMPQNTLEAFADHGVVEETVTRDPDEALDHLAALERKGIGMAEVTAQLEDEGVKAFADSFDSLWQALDEKRAALGSAGAALGPVR
jgi:transaldolase